MADRQFAENRFGLGPRGAVTDAIGDPRGWALAQIPQFDPNIANIPQRREVAQGLADYLDVQRMARSGRWAETSAMTNAAVAMADNKLRNPDVAEARRDNRDAYVQLDGARVDRALTTSTPFLERMTHFWPGGSLLQS